MKAYVVIGVTGEYSDRQEWTVVAYLDKARAEQHVVDATRRANEIAVLQGRYHFGPPKETSEFDPKLGVIDYDVRYHIDECDFVS